MRYLFVILITLVIVSCSVEPTNENNFKVSGNVYQKNQPAAFVRVELKKNNILFRETNTNDDGYFEFLNVPESQYKLITNKSYENGSFVEIPLELNVNDTIYLDTLSLPEPVTLYPIINVSNKSMTLLWSEYGMDNFYEYRLYRHSNSGLDESTGSE